MRLKILKNKMLMLRYENELCQRYLLLKLMPTLAIYKNAVHREHSVELLSSFGVSFAGKNLWGSIQIKNNSFI